MMHLTEAYEYWKSITAQSHELIRKACNFRKRYKSNTARFAACIEYIIKNGEII